jgi:hypothetical protein
LSGSGIISANGAAGTGQAGGGGGGRISLFYNTNAFNGVVSASGGPGVVGGGAGTIYTRLNSPSSIPSVLVSNGGLSGTNTPLGSDFPSSLPSSCDLTVTAGAIVARTFSFPILNSLNIGPGGIMTAQTPANAIVITVQHDVNIAAGGAFSMNGIGSTRGNGPGHGGTSAGKGSGAGYGGAGGASSSGYPGGITYGSSTAPQDLGSGGGAGVNTFTGGCDGGGAVRLDIFGTLTLDGTLSADGNPGLQDDSGGGSGGSIYVRAYAMTGSGNISANGGAGDLFGGGGGGGGRIAVYSPSNTFNGFITALGGIGASPGQTGTVYVAESLPDLHVISQTPSGTTSNVVAMLDLNFNNTLTASSVSASDFKIFAPSGAPLTNFTTALGSATTARLFFPQQLNMVGTYRIEAGPDIRDFFLQPMSQVYTGAFTVDIPTISGRVTDTNGLPVAGVTLTGDIYNYSMPATTDNNGYYEFGLPVSLNVTLTPSFGSFMFVPGSRSYTNMAASIGNQDYLMVSTIAPSLASGLQNGNLFVSWFGIPGVTYQLYSSTNLIDWSLYGSPIVGSNASIQFPLPIGNDPKQFVRIQAGN